MELTVHNIRRTLASNLRTFASRASDCSHNPHQIEIRSLDNHASRCIANANFCFQIYAIDCDAYSKIHDILHDSLERLRDLRKVYNAKNYICGQDRAIGGAKTALIEQVNRIWEVIDFYNDEAQATTEAEKDERWARHVSSQLKATN